MAAGHQAATADHIHQFQCFAIQNHDVDTAADIQKTLLGIRRQRYVARERRVVAHILFEEFAVAGKHLHAAVFAVGDIHHAIFGHANGVHDAELIRARAVGNGFQARRRAGKIIEGLVAECAPHAFELAAIGIEHRNAMVAVAVGNEQFVGLAMHPHVRRLLEILRVGIAFARRAAADLHDEFAVLREFDDLVIAHRLEAG